MGEVGWNGWGVGRWAVANDSSMSMLYLNRLMMSLTALLTC